MVYPELRAIQLVYSGPGPPFGGSALRGTESSRTGMTKVPWDYPWSSALSHLGITEHDPLVTDRILPGLVEDWERLLHSSDDGPLSTLRKLTRPAGRGCSVCVQD